MVVAGGNNNTEIPLVYVEVVMTCFLADASENFAWIVLRLMNKMRNNYFA